MILSLMNWWYCFSAAVCGGFASMIFIVLGSMVADVLNGKVNKVKELKDKNDDELTVEK